MGVYMKTEKKLNKIIAITIILLITIASLFQLTYADAAPKPSLTIIVKGMNEEKYWLDLLVTDEQNHSWLKISEEERKLVSKLAEYKDKDGFHPALLGGTHVPLNGELVGEKQRDGSFVHKFSYMGVPRTFKIAILTDDGNLIISDVIKRKQFASMMEYDLRGLAITENLKEAAGTVSEGMSMNDFIFNFIISLILTWIVEIFIAARFGFSLQKFLKVLLLSNVLTQVILNVLVLYFNNSVGLFGTVFGLILGEIIVILIEANIYSLYLAEKSKAYRISYAVTANLVSILFGFFIFFI